MSFAWQPEMKLILKEHANLLFFLTQCCRWTEIRWLASFHVQRQDLQTSECSKVIPHEISCNVVLQFLQRANYRRNIKMAISADAWMLHQVHIHIFHIRTSSHWWGLSFSIKIYEKKPVVHIGRSTSMRSSSWKHGSGEPRDTTLWCGREQDHEGGRRHPK